MRIAVCAQVEPSGATVYKIAPTEDMIFMIPVFAKYAIMRSIRQHIQRLANQKIRKGVQYESRREKRV